MANNLKKFTTEAEYNAATLNYPAVSWVTSGDTVHFDKQGAAVNDKVMVGFTCPSGEAGNVNIYLYNPYGTSPSTYFSSIAFDGTAISPISATIQRMLEEYNSYVIEYGITTSSINDCFAATLGFTASDELTIEFLVPSQVTSIDSMPSNRLDSLIIEATTPPTLSIDASDMQFGSNGKIYVPDESVDTYKSASGWSDTASRIYPISDYSGNLPV